VRLIDLSKVGPFDENRHERGESFSANFSATLTDMSVAPAAHPLEATAQLLEFIAKGAPCAHDGPDVFPVGTAGHQPLAMALELQAARLELVDGGVAVRQGGLESSGQRSWLGLSRHSSPSICESANCG
jgi:hypothetical protein